jgi:flagellar basal body-associated protein FliL
MITPLKATIDFKVKGNAVKQEVEKNQELVRSALRAVAALSKLADIGKFLGCMCWVSVAAH